MNQVRRASAPGRYKAEADASAFGTATVRERRALHEPKPPSRGPRSTVPVVVWAIDACRLAAGLSRRSMRKIEPHADSPLPDGRGTEAVGATSADALSHHERPSKSPGDLSIQSNYGTSVS